MHFEQCPYCQAKVFEHPKTKYCHKCSKLVLPNRCANQNCDAYEEQLDLPRDAEYCPLCRQETTNKAYLRSKFYDDCPF